MSKDLILPTHLRNTKAKRLKDAVKELHERKNRLKRAYGYIRSLERYIVSYCDSIEMSPLDAEFLKVLQAKHCEDQPSNTEH